MYALKPKEKCPGEEHCQTAIDGECIKRGRKLDDICHSDTENGGCRLYWTKPGTTPLEYAGFIEAVNTCRARNEAGLDLASYPIPGWAEKVYLLGVVIIKQVEAETSAEAGEGSDGATDFQLKGEGDSGAFSAVYQYFEQGRVKRVKPIYGRQRDGSS